MKFDEKTISILKNFSNINMSLLFRPGNVLSTISPEKNIFAKAKISQDIPVQFAIYDLGKLISVLSLFEKPSVEFKENWLIIGSKERQVKYTYTPPEMILAPPDKEINIQNPAIEFKLNHTDLSQLQKAADALQLPDILVKGEDGKINLIAADSKNPTGDTFNIEVGEAINKFTVIFKRMNLRLLPSDYNVEIVSRGIGHFYAEGLDYFIAVESDSVFGAE